MINLNFIVYEAISMSVRIRIRIGVYILSLAGLAQ